MDLQRTIFYEFMTTESTTYHYVSYPIFDPFNFMIKRKNDEKNIYNNNDEKNKNGNKWRMN